MLEKPIWNSFPRSEKNRMTMVVLSIGQTNLSLTVTCAVLTHGAYATLRNPSALRVGGSVDEPECRVPAPTRDREFWSWSWPALGMDRQPDWIETIVSQDGSSHSLTCYIGFSLSAPFQMEALFHIPKQHHSLVSIIMHSFLFLSKFFFILFPKCQAGSFTLLHRKIIIIA
ncbi:hypothetical protein BX600DRAFT_464307 [Xylariales sp. PMI_506]|nr:hypothetical protein BX600DRAFT_464307 [Xylariales sp. PMI_506]